MHGEKEQPNPNHILHYFRVSPYVPPHLHPHLPLPLNSPIEEELLLLKAVTRDSLDK